MDKTTNDRFRLNSANNSIQSITYLGNNLCCVSLETKYIRHKKHDQ